MSLIEQEIEYAKFIIPGILLGLASSVIANLISRMFISKSKLTTVIKIILQIIISVMILYILKESKHTNYLVEGSPTSTGVFQAFFFSTQVYMFADIASIVRAN